MKLKDAIVMYRATHNISMKDFAAKCGVSGQTIYNIESVGQSPSKITAVKIKLVLGDEYQIDEEEGE